MSWITVKDASRPQDHCHVYVNGKRVKAAFRAVKIGPFGYVHQATLHNGHIFLHGDEIATHYSFGLIRFEPLP